MIKQPINVLAFTPTPTHPPIQGNRQRVYDICRAIQSTGAQSKKEMGKVIGALKQRPEAPLIDFGVVSKIIQAKLP